MNSAIEVAELKVSYGEQTILDGVNMQVAPGDVAIVLGGSGCGKSTLLKTIIGLVEPAAGTVALFGQLRSPAEEDGPARTLKRVGVMFQYGALLNSITVGENVALPLEMHTDLGDGLIKDVVRTRLHLVGLDDAYALFPSELSGGMRKRAALARAMALDPEILFCDEPGAGLDPFTAAEIDHLLLTLNGSLGTTLVIVTHELLSIERMNGKLIMLDSGRVVFTGSVAEAKISDLPAVSRFFHAGDAHS
jgi:phospholipid/cholesterol/gamma-HCH transport system ATP-binding protein